MNHAITIGDVTHVMGYVTMGVIGIVAVLFVALLVAGLLPWLFWDGH